MRYVEMQCMGLIVRVWNSQPGNSDSPDYREDTYVGFAYDPSFEDEIDSLTHYDEEFDYFVGNDTIKELEGLTFVDDICKFEDNGYLTDESKEGILFQIPKHWPESNYPGDQICYKSRTMLIKLDESDSIEKNDFRYVSAGETHKLVFLNNKWHLLLAS